MTTERADSMMLTKLETLISRIDDIAALQAESAKQQIELTRAVTELTVNIEHFEKLRSENNARMDRLENHLSDCKDETRNRIEKSIVGVRNEIQLIETNHRANSDTMWKQINANTSAVNQYKPIIAIITVVLITAIGVGFGMR